MGLVNIDNKDVKLIMVGGKGGVGKTTCASGIALKLARDGRKVLIITSDPAPSLSDIFEKEIGASRKAHSRSCELYGLMVPPISY